MKNRLFATIVIAAVLPGISSGVNPAGKNHHREPLSPYALFDRHGAVIRNDTTRKVVYLIFSADEFGEGAHIILETLENKSVKGSFFLTGNFLRNPEFQAVVQRMKAGCHAIGPHSDRHLLYNSWEKRDSLLVSEKEFRKDLNANLTELRKTGAGKRNVKFFLAPYEWYNREIAEWSRETGLTLINFTPGTGTNADYTTPGMAGYKSSDVLWDYLLRFEERNRLGLNGAIVLVHLGTHPDRTDKFYNRLGDLIDELRRRGYGFGRF